MYSRFLTISVWQETVLVCKSMILKTLTLRCLFEDSIAKLLIESMKFRLYNFHFYVLLASAHCSTKHKMDLIKLWVLGTRFLLYVRALLGTCLFLKLQNTKYCTNTKGLICPSPQNICSEKNQRKGRINESH